MAATELTFARPANDVLRVQLARDRYVMAALSVGYSRLLPPKTSSLPGVHFVSNAHVVGGNLNVARGPASGSLSFTATNAPMDEDGNVIEGEPTDDVTVFGRGTAEITFGRILHGSATIIMSPDASITNEIRR